MKLKHYLLTIVVVVIGANGLLVARSDQSSSESPAVMAAVAPPNYPAIARAARAQGAVTVEVRVDERGEVLSAKMISGHPLLQKVSEEAAQQWRFSSIEGSTKQRAVRLVLPIVRSIKVQIQRMSLRRSLCLHTKLRFKRIQE